tara:strand:- start:166 stop:453 length:288 start_codon:yes stop_codon:yes gene_type:complete
MDGEAILKAYPQVVAIYEKKGCFDASGNKVTIEDSKVTEARNTLNAEAAAVKYKSDRQAAYPYIGDQLDDLYKQGAFSADMAAKLKKVKDDNPKP